MDATKKSLIEETIASDDLIANQRSAEILEGYKKISDIIARTYIAMGKNKPVQAMSASTGSDKILAYVFPSTH